MKISSIVVLLTLIAIVKGAWMNAALRGIEPVILTFGAAFAAFSKIGKKPDDDEEMSDAEFNEWFKKEKGFHPDQLDEVVEKTF